MHPEPQSTRDAVTAIVRENARHAAAAPLERLADALEAVAAEVDRLAAKLPASGEAVQ